MTNLEFYKGKKVFITGHTGFKGAWLCQILAMAGAKVTGYALPAPTNPSLFKLADIKPQIAHITGDVRDMGALFAAFEKAQPEIVLHLAAQPLVKDSYKNPKATYETNVMGTVNILECVRESATVKSFLNVTTDKVYFNNEWSWAYRETDVLNGYDPYSNSKSCAELVTSSYKNSFLDDKGIAVSTARAGNVIGGGDFSANRIIPDCVRAGLLGGVIQLRNPLSVRPYQHVLEPLFAYLLIARQQYNNPKLAGQFNVGPNESDCVTTQRLVQLFCEEWGQGLGWESTKEENAVHEANFLKLDCARIKENFNWHPCWDVGEAVKKTVEFTKVLQAGQDTAKEMKRQILLYTGEATDGKMGR